MSILELINMFRADFYNKCIVGLNATTVLLSVSTLTGRTNYRKVPGYSDVLLT